MMHFLASITLGALMAACWAHQPKYNRSFAVIAALAFGSVGLTARGGVLPQVLRHPAVNALGRAIVAGDPVKPRRRHA